MYCEHCGKELADTDRFCEHCGAPQKILTPPPVAPPPERASLDVRGWVRAHKKILIAALLALVAVLGAITGILYAATYINPRKYVSVSLSGCNGNGSASLVFDEEEELLTKLLEKAPSTRHSGEYAPDYEEMLWFALENMLAMDDERYIIQRIFTVDLEQSGESDGLLSNGDTVTAILEVDREALKDYGFRTTKESYTVSFVIGKDTEPLPEPTTLDLFSLLDLAIVGADGYGLLVNTPREVETVYDSPVDDYHRVRVCVESKPDRAWQPEVYLRFLNEAGEEIAGRCLSLDADKTENYTNGEKVTVRVRDPEMLKKYGLTLAENEKSYTAEKLREMEEIDLLGVLDYRFCGTEGFGYIQFVPGSYTIPVRNSGNGEKELKIEVLEDPHYDVYDSYTGRPNMPVKFVVHPSDKLEREVRFMVYAEPYEELHNGDEVSFGVYEGLGGKGLEVLKSAGYEIKAGPAVTVSGLLPPVELKLSDILDYSVSWTDAQNFELAAGTTKTTPLPENALGIRELVCTLGDALSSHKNYPLTFSFTTVDAAGNTQDHSITSEVFIQKDYQRIKFDMNEREALQLRDYGLHIPQTYELLPIQPETVAETEA